MPSAAATWPSPARWNAEKAAGRKVLVVDDEVVAANSVRRTLTRRGFRVDEAFSGREALNRILNEMYDLVLLDMKMPDTNGLELLPTIKKHRPKLPVVMVTGYASIDTAVEAIQRGATDYVAKPFTPGGALRRGQQGDSAGGGVARRRTSSGAPVPASATRGPGPGSSRVRAIIGATLARCPHVHATRVSPTLHDGRRCDAVAGRRMVAGAGRAHVGRPAPHDAALPAVYPATEARLHGRRELADDHAGGAHRDRIRRHDRLRRSVDAALPRRIARHGDRVPVES